MGRYSISVVAPFLNEERNIRSFLERTLQTLEKLEVDFEITLVDDGSSDSSARCVAEFVEENSHNAHRIKLVKNPRNQGIYQSWLTGLGSSNKQLAVLIDSDLQNPPEAIASLYNDFVNNVCHFVQGTRSSLEFDSKARLLMSQTLNRILNFAFRGNAQDHKSGLVLGPRALLLQSLVGVPRLQYGQTFIRAILEAYEFRIHETPTLFFPRTAGKSFLTGRQIPAVASVLREIPLMQSWTRKVRKQSRLASLKNRVDNFNYARQDGSFTSRIWKAVFFALLPFHTWNITYRTRKYLTILEKSEWLDLNSIQQEQRIRLTSLLWNCFGNVPYYRKLFVQAALLPNEMDPEGSLQELPLLSKEEVRNSLHFDLFSRQAEVKKLHKIATSGSTGTPFVTYVDQHQLDMRFSTTLRATQGLGWSFGKKQMRLWHQNLGLSRTQELKERLNALLSRRVFIPAFELNQEKLGDLVRLIEMHKPLLIDGYAESLNYISRAVQKGEIVHSPSAVMTSAQILTDQSRQMIESKLNTKVFDKYGSREFSGIAYECGFGEGMHVQWESYIIEVLRGNRLAKPGEIGEIVITDLNNFSVPLVRYRIGDLGSWIPKSSCECGRSSPKIGRIVGRTQALVLVADDIWLPGTFFAHFFKEYETLVGQFQIIQTVPSSFTLKAIKGPNWSEDAWARMMEHLGEYIGSEFHVETEYVGSIPLGRTGKRTPVISKIGFDFQSLQTGFPS